MLKALTEPESEKSNQTDNEKYKLEASLPSKENEIKELEQKMTVLLKEKNNTITTKSNESAKKNLRE